MMVIEFLQRVVEVLFDYFGGPVNETAMKENFVRFSLEDFALLFPGGK